MVFIVLVFSNYEPTEVAIEKIIEAIQRMITKNSQVELDEIIMIHHRDIWNSNSYHQNYAETTMSLSQK